MLKVASASTAPNISTDHPDPDRDLVAMLPEFEIARAEYERLDQRSCEIDDVAVEAVLPSPALLFRGSDRTLLNAYQLDPPADSIYRVAHVEVLRRGKFQLGDFFLERQAEIVEAYDRHQAAVIDAFNNMGGAEIVSARKVQNDILNSLAAKARAMPARSMAGLVAKARVTLWEYAEVMHLWRLGGDDDASLASVISDIFTMVPEAPPTAPAPAAANHHADAARESAAA